MIKLKRVPIFTIRVVYKSGYKHDFEVTKFTITPGKVAEWAHLYDENKPIHLGFDEVAAVWQVGVRYKWVIRY